MMAVPFLPVCRRLSSTRDWSVVSPMSPPSRNCCVSAQESTAEGAGGRRPGVGVDLGEPFAGEEGRAARSRSRRPFLQIASNGTSGQLSDVVSCELGAVGGGAALLVGEGDLVGGDAGEQGVGALPVQDLVEVAAAGVLGGGGGSRRSCRSSWSPACTSTSWRCRAGPRRSRGSSARPGWPRGRRRRCPGRSRARLSRRRRPARSTPSWCAPCRRREACSGRRRTSCRRR